MVGPGSVVAVEFGARPEQLGLGRVLTRAVGLGLGVAVGENADLELVVHEVASLLVAVAVPESVVRCEYGVHDTVIGVRVTARTREEPVTDGLGWYIVRALAGDAVLDSGPAEAGLAVRVLFSWPHIRAG
ncbi:hypothetical protein AB0H71_06430 [Nocardia sp. NPDC050697]|uniref:hypothetical protein n=1 Tax=Nocardia sp. NPDC050697 TaxID=3155158 RepID=UPI00340409FE